MQNKPNFPRATINVSRFETKDYEKILNTTLGENKPNSNPIPKKPKINVNSILTKYYENICLRGVPKNKPKTNPISQKAQE